jgi:hypothetical protein
MVFLSSVSILADEKNKDRFLIVTFLVTSGGDYRSAVTTALTCSK